MSHAELSGISVDAEAASAEGCSSDDERKRLPGIDGHGSTAGAADGAAV